MGELLEKLGLPPLREAAPAVNTGIAPTMETARPGPGGDGGGGSTGSGNGAVAVSASGGSADGGSGDGGDGKGLSDADRRERLREWARDQKVKGDVEGLAERLRNKKNKPAREQALKDFDAVQAKVNRGEVAEVPKRAAGDAGGSGGNARRHGGADDSEAAGKDKSVSTGGKRPLTALGLPENHGLDDADIRDFGKWLKDNHKAGDTGSEIDAKKKASVDGHDHLDTPEQVKKAVDQWKQETNWQERKGNAKGWHPGGVKGKAPTDVPGGKKKGGGGQSGGDQGGAGGGHGSSTPGSSGNPDGKTGGTGGGGASTAKEFQAEAEAFKERATLVERSANTIDTDAKALETKAEGARKQLRERRLDPESYFARMKTLEAERTALVTRRKVLVGQAEAMQLEAKNTVARMAKAMPREMTETFGKQTPEQLLARGRAVKPGVTASGLFNVFNAVMTGYDVVKSVQYVLAADNFMDGVERAIDVGGSFAVGAIEGEVLAYLAGSAAGGLGLAIVLQMPSDQGGDTERLEREAREKAEQQRTKDMARRERMMIGRYLEKTSPGSVEVIEDAVYVHDQKLWDKTVAEFHQLQAAQNAKQYATLRQRAYELGKSDGRIRSEMTHKDDIETWKEVKNAYNAMYLAMDLFTDYKQGYQAGNAALQALEDKVTRLAYADAKAGKTRDPKQVASLPEIGPAFAAGANPMTLVSDLKETYSDAYKAYVDQHRR